MSTDREDLVEAWPFVIGRTREAGIRELVVPRRQLAYSATTYRDKMRIADPPPWSPRFSWIPLPVGSASVVVASFPGTVDDVVVTADGNRGPVYVAYGLIIPDWRLDEEQFQAIVTQFMPGLRSLAERTFERAWKSYSSDFPKAIEPVVVRLASRREKGPDESPKASRGFPTGWILAVGKRRPRPIFLQPAAALLVVVASLLLWRLV